MIRPIDPEELPSVRRLIRYMELVGQPPRLVGSKHPPDQKDPTPGVVTSEYEIECIIVADGPFPIRDPRRLLPRRAASLQGRPVGGIRPEDNFRCYMLRNRFPENTAGPVSNKAAALREGFAALNRLLVALLQKRVDENPNEDPPESPFNGAE